ncbi:stage II sporulation protein P [uncultured Eubacterium sp.]|nr:stage II sporulation protein P [uncultured Eubacterium sp.]
MISEMIDGYYQGVFGGFCPVLLKKEETIKETILSDMIRIYYREAVPFLQYRTDYKDKKGQDLVQEDYYHFQDDETTDEVAQEVKKEAKIFHAKKWENPKYLRKYIYQIDSTTMAMDGELNGKVLLNMDLKLKKSEKPQILIYHTHGSETYRGSKKGKKSDTVIGVGDVLVKNLRKKNIAVIHDRNIYDVKNGKEERSKAYNYAANAIEDHLKKYPSIKVVIDLHRDGVSEQTKLVTTQKGRRMAQIMFFNGMSRTASNGDIKYLRNPNKQMNLAFSLQLQAQAAKKYPGFTRKIYMKGYRYNLHYRGRSLLVEVGAQNNTLSQAKASMSLLAELLSDVLY